jgi:hypothetical protein
MAPAALATVALAMCALQLAFAGVQAQARERQVAATVRALEANGVVDGATPIVTDHPVWMSDALGSAALILPRQGDAVLEQVMRVFGARYVVTNLEPDTPLGTVPGTGPCLERMPITAADAPQLVVYRSTGACQ